MNGTMWMPADPPTLWRVLAWHPQPIPVLPAVSVALLVAYLAAVVVLRRRGHGWPVGRTVWWSAGALSMLWTTGTALDGYGMELFSVHMVQHMVLGMLTPVFLVLGAPITLVLRVLPGRSWARRVLLAVLHSRAARAVTNPVVVSAIFLMSLYGLYFTPLFDVLMSTMWGHNLMLLHFVAVGFLYFWGILEVDPVPRHQRRVQTRLGGPTVPLLELGAGIPFHAFFGVALMTATTLLATVYALPSRRFGVSAIGDQQAAGGIAWAFTEVPTLLVLGALLIGWQRSEERRTVRSVARDRREEAELAAYNAQLARLAER